MDPGYDSYVSCAGIKTIHSSSEDNIKDGIEQIPDDNKTHNTQPGSTDELPVAINVLRLHQHAAQNPCVRLVCFDFGMVAAWTEEGSRRCCGALDCTGLFCSSAQLRIGAVGQDHSGCGLSADGSMGR